MDIFKIQEYKMIFPLNTKSFLGMRNAYDKERKQTTNNNNNKNKTTNKKTKKQREQNKAMQTVYV